MFLEGVESAGTETKTGYNVVNIHDAMRTYQVGRGLDMRK